MPIFLSDLCRSSYLLQSSVHVQVWYFLFVLFFAGVTGLLCSPKVKNLYYAKQWYWDWDYDLPWSWAIETIETYWDIGSFAVAGILYFLQIMLMVRMVSGEGLSERFKCAVFSGNLRSTRPKKYLVNIFKKTTK